MTEGDLDQIANDIARTRRARTETYWSDLRVEIFAVTVSPDDSDNILNRHWFLRILVDAYNRYATCISRIRTGEFFEAWCELERIEIDCTDLATNPVYPALIGKVSYLSDAISNWQALFPYAVFFSPEYIARRSECTICGNTNTPWTFCGHETGKLYRGEVAHRRVVEAELLGISFVTTPVQKYSVAFAAGGDELNYEVLRFVVDRLASPFDGWRSRETVAYRPHHLFAGHAPSDPCPCGSGRRYNKCCLPLPGVVGPHMQIEFERPPPSNLPNFVLPKELRSDDPSET